MYKQLLINHESEEIVPGGAMYANSLGRPWALFTGGSLIILPTGTDQEKIPELAVKYIQDHGDELNEPNDPVDWTLTTLSDDIGWVAQTTKPDWMVFLIPDDVDGEVYPKKILQTSFFRFRFDWIDQEVLAISDGL